MGFQPHAQVTIGAVNLAYDQLAGQWRGRVEDGDTSSAANILMRARRIITTHIAHHGEMAAPGRIPPGVPGQGLQTSWPTHTQEPAPTAIRQLPPALRKWLRDNVLGSIAGEALQSPLTATCGIFSQAPLIHGALLHEVAAAGWAFGSDEVDDAMWHWRPWPHDVLVTAKESGTHSLDRVIQKAQCTAAAGHKVILALASDRTWEELKKTGATQLVYLPAGTVPLGDAVGWGDSPSTRTFWDGTPWPSHSWRTAADGAPTASEGDNPARLRRHEGMMNDQKVDILLYPKGAISPSAEVLAELAWILAGTGGRPRKQWATWLPPGTDRETQQRDR